MNILEQFLNEENQVAAKSTKFKYGTYITMRHNTNDVLSVVEEFNKIYLLSYHLVKGAKVSADQTYTTPRVPVESRVKKSMEQKLPIMISSLQVKATETKQTIFSHHFLYGGQWSVSYQDDYSYVNDLKSALPNYISTVTNNQSNILIQPIGLKDDQSLDRPTDKTFYDYITNYVNDREEDTLLTQMVKQSPTGQKFALYYSYIR